MVSLLSWLKALKNILSPRYLKKRLNFRFVYGAISRTVWEKKHPKEPWLTPVSVDILKGLLKKDDFFLEFGSGQSTVWFARKVGKIISIESNEGWYQKTKSKLKRYAKKAEIVFAPDRKKYLAILNKIKDNSLDICLVDGEHRIDCMLGVLRKIKKGGALVVDNAETILPIIWESHSFQDSWLDRGSPDKAKIKKILAELSGWRMIATSDVVQDTIIWIK